MARHATAILTHAHDLADQLRTEAQADADAARLDARALIQQARAEAAVLTRRRTEVTAQLGHPSGALVRQALTDGVSEAWQSMEGRQ